MWAFLNPIALWALAAAAIPLAIHFLGSNKLKSSPFPSLMLLKEELSRASRQNRLKNLLLLLLRTLFILCVVLALGNPVYRTSGTGVSSDTQISFVINNGVFSGLKTENGELIYDVQENFLSQLDSGSNATLKKHFLIPQSPAGPSSGIYERYGNYKLALETLKDDLLQSSDSPQNIYIPFFRYKELLPALSSLEKLSEQLPGAQFILVDGTRLAAPVPGIEILSAKGDDNKPVFHLEYKIHQEKQAKPGTVLRNFLGDNLLQETGLNQLSEDRQLTIQLNSSAFYKGRVEISPLPAFPKDYYFVYKAPQKINVLHVGKNLASLASLGAPNQLKNIEHVPGFLSSHKHSLSEYSAVVIANPALIPDAVFSNLLNYVKQGGRVIFIPGENTDIPRINRNLLVPSKMGFLSSRSSARLLDTSQAALIDFKTQSLGDIHQSLQTLAPSAYIARQYQMTPHLNAEVLLQSSLGALLLRCKLEKGFIYLWTSDLDDLDWTSLGASAFLPILHQWIIGEGKESIWKNSEVFSDSQWVYPVDPEAGDKFQVLDPEGNVFSEVKERYNSRVVGPFYKTGIYQMIKSGDSSYLAVNLAPPQDDLSREKFLELLKEHKGAIQILDFNQGSRLISTEGKLPLWKYFLMAAAVFLLLELAVSKFLTPQIKAKKQA